VRILPDSVIRRLGALGEVSRSGKRVNGLFRLMESPLVWMEAYANISANKGATTRGVTPNTLDGFTDARVVNLQTLLKEGRYRPPPVKRPLRNAYNNSASAAKLNRIVVRSRPSLSCQISLRIFVMISSMVLYDLQP